MNTNSSYLGSSVLTAESLGCRDTSRSGAERYTFVIGPLVARIVLYFQRRRAAA